MSEVVTINWVK